ncbi:MAG: hypothetical protein C4516_03025 [Oxalobacter sp.]|nr:MAG: hypothetical protein C4516_03025 [Oxalobacter sp.]
MANWVSIVIAVAALGVTFWQVSVARRHNKLSVLPMIVHHNKKNITNQGTTFSYVIKNVGIGPALITDRYFEIQSNRFIPNETGHLIKELCDKLIGRSHEYHVLSSGMFGAKAKIPAGAEFTLAEILFPRIVREDQVQIIEALFEKAAFVIKYESIYGEQFSYHTDE